MAGIRKSADISESNKNNTIQETAHHPLTKTLFMKEALNLV
jgi:hypothetical protein